MNNKLPKLTLSKTGKQIEVLLDRDTLNLTWHELELTLFVYLQDRALRASHFTIQPFEEYATDIAEGKRSTFRPITPLGDKLFGLILGGMIAAVFAVTNPADLVTAESTVSIFAAYTIGKELWRDLNQGLINLTQKWRLSWRDRQYYYRTQNFGTIQQLWEGARRERYQRTSVSPELMDFIAHSNSKTVELLYYRKAFAGDSQPRLLGIDFNADTNYTIGIKLALVSWYGPLAIKREVFQSRRNSGEASGIIYKRYLVLGRGKLLLSSANLTGKLLVANWRLVSLRK